ncbi:hypothetical protein D9M69_666440 [compost metagenome]
MIGNIGMAHDGIESIPETGSWYLKKGERVTTAETSAKLDATLDRVNQQMVGGESVVNIHNYSGQPVQERRSRGADRREVIDIIVGDIDNGGPTAKVINRITGTRRVGQ